MDRRLLEATLQQADTGNDDCQGTHSSTVIELCQNLTKLLDGQVLYL